MFFRFPVVVVYIDTAAYSLTLLHISRYIPTANWYTQPIIHGITTCGLLCSHRCSFICIYIYTRYLNKMIRSNSDGCARDAAACKYYYSAQPSAYMMKREKVRGRMKIHTPQEIKQKNIVKLYSKKKNSIFIFFFFF